MLDGTANAFRSNARCWVYQMGPGWEPDGNQMGTRWEPDGTWMGTRWEPDGVRYDAGFAVPVLMPWWDMCMGRGWWLCRLCGECVLGLYVCDNRDGWLVAWGLCGCMMSRSSTVWLLPFTLL